MINNIKKLFFKENNVIINDKNFFINLHKNEKNKSYENIDLIENELGYKIDKIFFEDLALYTQIVNKKSLINYQHGRLLYSYLSFYINNTLKKNKELNFIKIFETGTARGFSSICMVKAILDNNICGNLITLDILPHEKRIFWNCITDCDGIKSRKEILLRWKKYTEYIDFYQTEAKIFMKQCNPGRLHFAFLDAQHKYKDVMEEYSFVSQYQIKNDIIIFDDVTQGTFDGVLQAVKEIELSKLYKIRYLQSSEFRGYAIAIRLYN